MNIKIVIKQKLINRGDVSSKKGGKKLENREIYLLSGNEVLQFAKEINEVLKDGKDFKPTGRRDKSWGIVLSEKEVEFLKSRGVLIELVSDHNDPDDFIRSRFVT